MRMMLLLLVLLLLVLLLLLLLFKIKKMFSFEFVQVISSKWLTKMMTHAQWWEEEKKQQTQNQNPNFKVYEASKV